MSNIQTIEKIKAFTLDDIMSVYSGKPGCCCGCNGNHRYASQYVEVASKNRGYAVEQKEVNDRQVRNVVAKIQNNAAEAQDFGSCISLDLDGRVYIMYLLPEVK